jgi:tricorn protease
LLSFRRSRLTPAALTLLAAAAGTSRADVTPHAEMLRFPDVSATQIAFVYANNLWVAPRSGGLASPVAAPPGVVRFPRFSPDGSTLAFVGAFDGNTDLYTVPVAGGIPFRVSHHPTGESLCDWYPAVHGTQGPRLMFLGTGFGGLGRQSQLISVSPAGGLPLKLPVPYAGFGSVSPDGKVLAYTLHSVDNRTWKRYRGGMATDVWLFDLTSNTSRQITDWEGVDTLPLFNPTGDGNTVYYLSDNGPEHRMNIWAFDRAAGTREQLTKFADDDIKWPSVGPGTDNKGEIVFQLGSRLMLLNLGSRQSQEVKISIPGVRPTIRPRTVDAARFIQSGDLSPTGQRVLFGGRGDVWSVPVKEGVVRNLTRTDSVFERSPTWSPDGKWIAYFSDAGGEYDLYVQPSDALPPEKKDDAKKDEKKDDAKPAGGTALVQRFKPTKLTDLGPGFRNAPVWSPDGKHVVYSDNGGKLRLTSITVDDDAGTIGGETKEIDTDPWSTPASVSWSHDSSWLAYTREHEGNSNTVIWLYNVKSGEKTAATSPMFSASSPAFDRSGDFLYYVSNRRWASPIYGSTDTTFTYAMTEVLHAVPLRNDVKNPFLPESDEERTKPEDKKGDDKKDDKKPDDKAGEKKDEKKPDAPASSDDGVSGTWTGEASNVPNAPGPVPLTVKLRVGEGGAVTGTVSSPMGSADLTGNYDKASGTLTVSFSIGGGNFSIAGSIKGTEFTGSWSGGENQSGNVTLKRTAGPSTDDAKTGDKPEAKKDEKKDKEPLKIDLEGFERRAMVLPVPAGSFRGLEVAHDGKLLYVRGMARGMEGDSSIRIFDIKADEKEEKTVISGAGGFQLSADGKKLGVFRGPGNISVHDPVAGGGKAQPVSTAGMRQSVDPRAEWQQLFNDAWRIFRDYFYVPNMHGVDWPKVRDHYAKMLEDAASRQDVQFILGEMVSELNVGHAYIQAPGDIGDQPTPTPVGMLGVDFELATTDAGTAYRIARIYEGGPFDSDARGPLSKPFGKEASAKVGDFLLAVNGVPVDTAVDPWAPFLGTAGRPTTITVSDKPVLDASARDVLVQPMSDEGDLRYRAWVEGNRTYVLEKSNGEIGYIYVPNTGVDGQDELFRQFFGQRHLPALIIDDRWNGGGQIPTRFIELLNRPVVNFWARRHGNDWPWPPDAHFGPKAMLINGLAGSGGDAFPAYFRKAGLGKLIGTRTWGGLVGISGNPSLIDGGTIAVPTFGFYDPDGTWGIEGHGVDPDLQVIDDPAKMVPAGDPQLDAAINHLKEELATKRFNKPARPAAPDRSGMGILPQDK